MRELSNRFRFAVFTFIMILIFLLNFFRYFDLNYQNFDLFHSLPLLTHHYLETISILTIFSGLDASKSLCLKEAWTR